MSPVKNARAIKIAGLIILVSFVLLYAGGLVLGATVNVSLLLIRLLEFIGVVGIPLVGCAVLLWFAYKLFLEPVLRQRKLDRIRDYRARRDGSSQDNGGPV